MTAPVQPFPDEQSWALPREPDLDEVLQLEPVMPVVPVDVEGAVRVQQLPIEDPISFSKATDDVTGDKLINANALRGYLTIIPVDQPAYIGFARDVMQAPTCGIVPKGTPLVVPARAKVWFRSATPGSPVTVSVFGGQFSR